MFLGVVINNSRPLYFTRNGNQDDDRENYLEPGAKSIDSVIALGLNAEKQSNLREGYTRFYLYRNSNNAVVLVITGVFKSKKVGDPDITFLKPGKCPGLACFFECYAIEKRISGQRTGFSRLENNNLLKDMNRDLCGPLGKFSGWPWTDAKNDRINKDDHLAVVYYNSFYHLNRRSEVLSCDSSISSLSGAGSRRSIIVKERMNVGRNVFNPNGLVVVGDRLVTNIIFGKRYPTVFHAFLSGLTKLGKNDAMIGLRILLGEAQTPLASVSDDFHGKLKVYYSVFTGSNIDIDGPRGSSAAIANEVSASVGTSDSARMRLYAEKYLTEKFHSGIIGDFQLAAVCDYYKVNVEIYHQSTKQSVISADKRKFLRDEGYSTIKIMKCGVNLSKLYKKMSCNLDYAPDYVYCLLETGVDHRLFVDDYVFNPWRLSSPVSNTSPDVDFDSFSLSWLPSVFDALTGALIERGIVGRGSTPQHLLRESRQYLLNILDRVDEDRVKVYEYIFRDRHTHITPEESSLCYKLILDCHGSDAMRADEDIKRLFSYLYVCQHFRSGRVGDFQLAAFCLCFEVNVDIYTRREDHYFSQWSGDKFFYGSEHSFTRIEIIENITTYAVSLFAYVSQELM